MKFTKCPNLMNEMHSQGLGPYLQEHITIILGSDTMRLLSDSRLIFCLKFKDQTMLSTLSNNFTCLSLSICDRSRSRSIFVKSLRESTLRPFSLDADRQLLPPAELLLALPARPSNSRIRLYNASFSSMPRANCSPRETASTASRVSASHRQHAAASADSASVSFCRHSSLSSWYL